jgi:hypothetical protein
MDPATKPKQKPDYRLEVLDNELLLYHLNETKILYCNQTASLIWQLCDGQHTVADITMLISDAVQHLQSEGEVAEYLLGQTCHHLADRGHGGLLLHAAGLNWQGQGVILPGQMRSGKSTLAAWLLTRGWQYLTDELVFIPHKTTDFQAFSRPLNLKWTARTILQQLFDVAGQANEILSSPGGDLIPPELLGSRNVFSASPLNLMIFPRYHRDGAFELRQLSKAQGGLELMKCLVNARNLPGHGFPEVVRIARAVPAYRMIYSNFAQVEQAIEGLFESKL